MLLLLTSESLGFFSPSFFAPCFPSKALVKSPSTGKTPHKENPWFPGGESSPPSVERFPSPINEAHGQRARGSYEAKSGGQSGKALPGARVFGCFV